MKTSTADKWFSMFIRLRDCDDNGIGTCCTCGVMKDVKNMDNSHFIGRQHQATRFSEMNCHTACKRCNGFEEGRKDVYREFLIKKYGEAKVALLEMEGRKTVKRTKFDLEYIAIYYKKLAEQLAKEKHIKLW